MRMLCFAPIFAVVAVPTALAQEPTIERRVLSRNDLAVPGYEVVLVEGTLPVGAREGRHTHPGALVGYVLSGTITLEHEDRDPVVYAAGDAFEIEPDTIHEGINTGNTPVRLVAAFIVEKDRPMTTQIE